MYHTSRRSSRCCAFSLKFRFRFLFLPFTPPPSRASSRFSHRDNASQRFAIKTHDEEGIKVFVNICSSSHVPLPVGWPASGVPQVVQEYLTRSQNTAQNPSGDAIAESFLSFPTSISPSRRDTDRQGVPCTVIDVVYSDTILDACTVFRPLKIYICTLSICQVEKAVGRRLERKFKLPKMKSKGQPAPLRFTAGIAPLSSNTTPKTIVSGAEEPLPSSGKVQLGDATIATSGRSSASPSPQLALKSCNVAYKGRPCDRVILSATIPEEASIDPDQIRSGNAYVDIQAEKITVDIPSCLPWHVQLPFLTVPIEGSVSADSAVIDGDERTLRIELEVVPFKKTIQEGNNGYAAVASYTGQQRVQP